MNTLEDNRTVEAFNRVTEKLSKWYGHVMRMKQEHKVRMVQDVDIPRKRRGGGGQTKVERCG